MKIENLSFSYGDKKIFENLNVQFPESGTVFIDAPSGRGKTTLFHLIAGIYRPRSGRIEKENKKIAYMFQEDRLFPEFSALENVFCVRDGSRTQAAELLEQLGLGAELASLPKALSGGMKRRVALARALNFNAEILLLDEPFKGLDADTASQTAEVLKNHSKEKLLLIASHITGHDLWDDATVFTLP